jgi:Protein of unknown function (DUF3036).
MWYILFEVIRMSQKELAKILKIIIILVVLISLPCFIFVIPEMVKEMVAGFPEFLDIIQPFCIYVWISAIPFYYAFVLTWFICNDIRDDNSYSSANINRLKRIAYLSIFEAIYYACFPVYMQTVYNAGQPVFLILCFLIVLASIAIAVLASILSRLTQKAYDYKVDSELAV